MSGNLDLARAQDGYTRGATLVINRLEKFWPPCTALAKQMEDAVQIFTSLNMYFTPPGSRGFDPHFDYEDVFIVQVQGIKRWRVWEPDPAVGQEFLALNDERSRQSKAKSAVPTTAPRYRCHSLVDCHTHGTVRCGGENTAAPLVMRCSVYCHSPLVQTFWLLCLIDVLAGWSHECPVLSQGNCT